MAINRLVVSGFKCIRDRLDLDLRGLTLLAGANSSGKSSALQPLLLLKQTYEAGYDPGPLLISGPNVAFSSARQLFWKALAGDEADRFVAGMHVQTGSATAGVEVTFATDEDGTLPLRIDQCSWITEEDRYDLPAHVRELDLQGLVPQVVADTLRRFFDYVEPNGWEAGTRRARSVLKVELNPKRGRETLLSLNVLPSLVFPLSSIEPCITKVIHVPALRGTPRRTYPVSAVSDAFPGLFQDYAASVIARWQSEDKPKIAQLGEDLHELGLTWKVRARQVSDTSVEIRVGRLSSPQRYGSRDLVNVADVGFGVCQVLPVSVALLVAQPGHLVYLEQPEIHLHPNAQLALAGPLARAVKRGVNVVVETHSELLLLGIQRAVAEGELGSDEVVLHWFSRGESGETVVAKGALDDQGTFGDWPVDFAEVSLNAMRSYLTASMPA